MDLINYDAIASVSNNALGLITNGRWFEQVPDAKYHSGIKGKDKCMNLAVQLYRRCGK